MSTTIIFAIFGVVVAISCAGSWQLALRWHNRTRDAHKEDPRDQEIRELSAALNIARKELEKLGQASGTQDSEITELREKLQQSGDSLTDALGKYTTTKETLNKEIEEREALQEEIRQLQADLERSNTRLQELEVQTRIDSAGSGLVAGLDDMLDDDEKEAFQLSEEHKLMKQLVADLQSSTEELEAEATKWKQHCTVMSKTNKSLRSALEETTAARREQAETSAASMASTEQELTKLRAETEALQRKLAEQQATEEILEAQANQVKALQEESKAWQQSAQQISELEIQLEEMARARDEALKENFSMQQQLDAIAQLEHNNQRLIAELDDARTENRNLTTRLESYSKSQNQSNNVRGSMADHLSLEQRETAALKERVDTLSAEVEKNKQRAAYDSIAASVDVIDPHDDSNDTDDTAAMPSLGETRVKEANGDADGPAKDDLQQIKGVGARLEQKLNMLGINKFRNLVELGPEDYVRAQALIPSLKARAERDAWMDQARELHAAKYNESL